MFWHDGRPRADDQKVEHGAAEGRDRHGALPSACSELAQMSEVGQGLDASALGMTGYETTL